MTARAPSVDASTRVGNSVGVRRPAAWRTAAGLGLVLAATWAVAGSAWLEPELSSNLDEQAYLHQAELLAHGHLSVSVPGEALARNFQPWFAAATDHGYIFKYNLVWPAALTLPTLISASRLTLALALVLFLVGTYALTREVLASRGKSVAAAAVVALSPLTIVQSTTFLSYVWFGGLWTLAAAVLVRGTTRSDRRVTAAAGALGAIAFCARPYDALLVLTPFVVWAGGRAVVARGRTRGSLAWAGIAALPVLGAQAAYNAYVTGDALKLPYSLWSSTDRLGFGYRGLLPSGVPQTYFGPRQGLHGVADNLWALNLWAFGGVVLVLLALVGLVASRRKPEAWALAAVAATVPFGYLFFWGIANISFLSKALDRFGPYYFVPVLVPLAAFGADGATRVWAWRRGVLVSALVAALVITGIGAVRGLTTALDERDVRAQPYDALDTVTDRARPALVFLPGDYVGTSVLNRYTVTTSDRHADLYVVSNDNADIALVRRYGEHAPSRIVACDYAGQTPLGTEVFPGDDPSVALVTGRGARARALTLLESPSGLVLRVGVTAAVAAGARVEVAAGTFRVAAPLQATGARAASVLVQVISTGVQLGGDVGPVSQDTGMSGPLTVHVVSPVTGDHAQSYTWTAPVDLRGTSVAVLTPGRTSQSNDFPLVPESETCARDQALTVSIAGRRA